MSDTTNSYTYQVNRGRKVKGGISSGVYGLAFIGSLVYYLQHAATFGAGLLGILKALFWPAVLVYNVMEFLRM